MNHPFRQRLSEYLDDELEGEAAGAGELEAHLAGCPACQEELAGLRRLKARLASLPDFPPPESMWERIQAQVTGDAGARGGARRFWPAAAGLLALAALMAFFAVLLGQRAGDPGGAPPPPSPGLESARAWQALQESDIQAYEQAAGAWRSYLAEENRLPGSAAALLVGHLATLDQALAEIHAALALSPDDERLRLHLLRTLRYQVRLLEQAGTVPRGGSGEGDRS